MSVYSTIQLEKHAENKFSNIFIYGVPGSGKTYLSRQLGNRLNVPVIEGDKLKDKARAGKKKQDDPFLFLGTCQAWKQFGVFSKDNVIKGLLAVREALVAVVQDEAAKTGCYILEAGFLDPNVLRSQGRLILFTTQDEKHHRRQFFSHREKLLDISGNEFKAARIIQDYLIEEAERLNVEVLDNDGFDVPSSVLAKLGPLSYRRCSVVKCPAKH